MFENVRTGYFYDDLLLRPKRCSIPSRANVDMSTEIVPGVVLKSPVISSPMSTITESKMAIKMYEIGGLGILHRFERPEHLEQEMQVIAQHVPYSHRAFSIGIKKKDTELLDRLAPHANIVCVDVNVGHHEKTIEMVKHIRDNYPDHKIIAGSVSTYEGTNDLCEAGAHAIRATNGGGSMCTTMIKTGVGIPTASSLAECIEAADRFGASVIADGGIDTSGTLVKALALGAKAAMFGGMLAGTSAVPESAFFLDPNDGVYKAKYFGMASREAQERRGDDVRADVAPEGMGVSVYIRGKTKVIVNELLNGVRSGMTMVNAANLQQLRENAEWVIVNRWPNSFSGKK